MQDNELEPFLTLEVRNALIQHMIDAESKECCGLITLSKGEYEYVPKENVNPEPTEHYSFDKETKAAISRQKSIVAYCHSHPNGPEYPSKRDQEIQNAVKKPGVIAYRDPDTGVVGLFSFGDHLLDAPLVGRDFRYAQFDCMFAFRSWVWQNEGRTMPPAPPSDHEWWLKGADNAEELLDNPNYYEKLLKDRYGYEEFTPDLDNPEAKWAPQRGDAVLMQLGAPVINHVAVYEGDNLIYHHRAGKQSAINPIGYLWQMGYIRKWARHESKL